MSPGLIRAPAGLWSRNRSIIAAALVHPERKAFVLALSLGRIIPAFFMAPRTVLALLGLVLCAVNALDNPSRDSSSVRGYLEASRNMISPDTEDATETGPLAQPYAPLARGHDIFLPPNKSLFSQSNGEITRFPGICCPAAGCVDPGALIFSSRSDLVPKATNEDPRTLFYRWLRKFPRAYTKNAAEVAKRSQIFADNLKFILQHNAKGKGFGYGCGYASRLLAFLSGCRGSPAMGTLTRDPRSCWCRQVVPPRPQRVCRPHPRRVQEPLSGHGPFQGRIP